MRKNDVIIALDFPTREETLRFLDRFPAGDKPFGYRMYQSAGEYMDALARLYEKEIIPCLDKQALSAAVYTQVSDVEDEVNGILTFDRKSCKVDVPRMQRINGRLRF